MSTSTTIAAPEQPAATRPGLLSRIAQVFVSPGELFAGFREHAPWGGALGGIVLIILVAACVAFFFVSDQMLADFMKEQALASGATQLPPDEVLLQGAKVQKVISAIANPIIFSIFIFLTAGICSLAFSVLGGGTAKYGQYVAIVAHAMFIYMLGEIIATPFAIASGRLDLSFSLGAVAPQLGFDTGTFVNHLMKQVDVFLLWTIAVIGIGVATVNGKRSWVIPAGLLYGVYLFFAAGIPLVIKVVTSA